ncbi:hypothetical protein PVAP13_9NG158973 [Panicum virgatum]|uniref:Uncharacterized protein n=1 Tax=Panicum virgatum TaxID=38727 RepID=A0A8T0MH97_PANVG|nr:hypothetical protein PVAP13_9NG158973 [Panicum virgatum]
MQHYYNSVKPLLYGTRIVIHPILSSISSTAGARAPPPTPPPPAVRPGLPAPLAFLPRARLAPPLALHEVPLELRLCEELHLRRAWHPLGSPASAALARLPASATA